MESANPVWLNESKLDDVVFTVGHKTVADLRPLTPPTETYTELPVVSPYVALLTVFEKIPDELVFPIAVTCKPEVDGV
jgi:hypothetical protein